MRRKLPRKELRISHPSEQTRPATQREPGQKQIFAKRLMPRPPEHGTIGLDGNTADSQTLLTPSTLDISVMLQRTKETLNTLKFESVEGDIVYLRKLLLDGAEPEVIEATFRYTSPIGQEPVGPIMPTNVDPKS